MNHIRLVVVALTLSGCSLKLGPPEPTIGAFTTVSETVAAGAPVELTYSVTDADSLSVSVVGGADLLPASTQLTGSIFTPPLLASTTFILIAHNQDALATKTLNVVVGAGTPNNDGAVTHASIVGFQPSASDVEAGGSATLDWQTSAASSGVILANDAILTTIAAADIADGSFTVSPSINTTYTLSVIGSDGQQVTLTTAISVSAVGAGPITARDLFDATVKTTILQAKCSTCHQTGSVPDLLGSGPDTYYDRITADPRFIPALPEDSLLLVKGAHAGPALLPAEAQAVTSWLVKEATARAAGGGGGGGAPPPPSGDFRPRTVADALTRFGACMDRAVWDATYGVSADTMIAQQGSETGPCTACHATGTGGAFLSESSGDTFDMARVRPYILKYVLTTANEDGSFKDLVAAHRFQHKGEETDAGHPGFVMAQERIDAVDSFVDQTMASFHDFTKSCAAPGVGP